MADLFTVIVRTPVTAAEPLRPKASEDINPRITDLRWSITHEQGYQSLEFGMSSDSPWPMVGTIPAQMDIELSDDITVMRGSLILWEGRVVEIERGGGGMVTGCIAEGYYAALNDGWNTSTSTTTITTGAALEYIIEYAAPMLSVGNSEQFIDPLVQWAAYTVVLGIIRGGIRNAWKMTGGEMVSMVVEQGNSEQDAIAFMVLSNRTAHLFPLVLPDTGPHYTMPFDARRMTWREHRRDMASHVTVEYAVEINDGDQTLTIDMTSEAESDGFYERYGFFRRVIVPIGTTTPAVATAVRDRELTKRSAPSVQSTITITSDESTWLGRGGAPWPWYAILPGEWVQAAGRQPLPIIAVSIDATAGETVIETGARDMTLPKNMHMVDQTRLNIFQKFGHAVGTGGAGVRVMGRSR